MRSGRWMDSSKRQHQRRPLPTTLQEAWKQRYRCGNIPTDEDFFISLGTVLGARIKKSHRIWCKEGKVRRKGNRLITPAWALDDGGSARGLTTTLPFHGEYRRDNESEKIENVLLFMSVSCTQPFHCLKSAPVSSIITLLNLIWARMSYFCAGRLLFLTYIFALYSSSFVVSRGLIQPSNSQELSRRGGNDLEKVDPAAFARIQISDGKTGNSREKASKVFLEPYNLTLSSNFAIEPAHIVANITKAQLKKIGADADVSKYAEAGFVAAIDNLKKSKRNKALILKLEKGMRSNKCLKLLGQQTVITILIAQGNKGQIPRLAPELKKKTLTDLALSFFGAILVTQLDLSGGAVLP
ncbi:hypothetical protein CROQUDRAFT_103396 [Cronartium quercuum f. sp. fusiforme G11]|uniref:Uncharacterized protein n=1 Tax=Cronartium quercuum f. sp. fusiforme G11 TaxID=708437 RepID=A0A9P6TH43_9BASI|nr:hypothetical protein CROQUDRAFT_103396 [Cronartium quercuum f. sp. fusiforme G11]